MEMQVFALGGPQGNTGQKSVLAKKPMRDLGKAMEHAESLSELAWSRPDTLHTQSSTDSKRKPLLHRLVDVYLEESKKEAHTKKLRCASHLLDKLVKRDFLNTLVVNLYPGNEGYSLMIKGRNGCNSETIKLPYEEVELLEYIDAEELPPLLVDLLDKLALNVFYSGCVIVELRDYRRTTDGTFDSQHVLLRPTSHSMLCDLNTLTNDEHRWTQEDKFTLESQLLLATSDPLCLHPSPAVSLVTNKLNYEKQKLSTHALKRSVKSCSQAAVSRRRRMAQCPAPSHLRLHDFVCRKKEKLKPVPHVNLKVSKTCVDMWRQRDVELTMPETIEVEKYAKVLEKPKQTLDNTPVTVEEFTLETERSHGKVNYSRLTILQRLSDEFYSGMLYVDRDYSEGKSEGSTCRFPLGTKANVEKYITQFREIFTEEGRRQVKITHQVLGQPATVSYTQNTQTGVQVTVTGAGPLLTPGTGLAATITGQLTVPGMNGNGSSGQKVQPIKLSLSLNPQVSVAPGNLVSPQGAAVQGQMLGQAQLTLNIQQQHQHTATGGVGQRGRPMYTGVSRAVSTSSPASAAVVSSAQLPTYAQATACLTSVSATGAPVGLPKTATPSATPSPTSSTPGNTAQSLPQVVNVGSFLPGDGTSGIMGKLSTASLNVMAPGITIGSLAGMSQNFNLANLQGLQNLQNVQVSLGSVTLPGGIAVPLSLINTTPSLSTPTGLLVSSLTGGHSATAASGSADVGSSLSTPLVSSSNSSVTVTLATSSSATAAGVSGLLTSPTQVLSTPSGLLSLPIGVAGNLTQIMAAAGLKPGHGIRPGTPLFLSPIPGQQSVQLLSAADFPQASRAQLGVAPQVGRRQSTGRVGTSTIPASVILTAQSHGDGGLQVRAGGQALTTQQLMQTSLQLAACQSATLTSQQVMQLTPQQQQQVAAQLALQKQQLSKSPQVAITATRVQHGSLASKMKSKKRSQSKS